MKDCPDEWRVLMTPKKRKKGKQPEKDGRSKKTNSLTMNSSKVVENEKDDGGSATIKKLRQQNTIPKPTT
jgi:hypothetical protein